MILFYIPPDPSESYTTNDNSDYGPHIVLSFILHFTNHFINNQVIQSIPSNSNEILMKTSLYLTNFIMNDEVFHAEVVGYILATYQILISHCIFETSLLTIIRSPLNSITTLPIWASKSYWVLSCISETTIYIIMLCKILYSILNFHHLCLSQFQLVTSSRATSLKVFWSDKSWPPRQFFTNIQVPSQIEAPFFLLFHELFAFFSHFYALRHQMRPPPPVHLRTVKVT